MGRRSNDRDRGVSSPQKQFSKKVIDKILQDKADLRVAIIDEKNKVTTTPYI